MPTRTSPDAELTLTSPATTASIDTSPLAVFAFASPSAAAIDTSPLAVFAESVPRTRPRSMSPDAVFTDVRPPTSPELMSPLAPLKLRSPVTVSNFASPDAVATSAPARVPATLRSADFVRAFSDDPSGHVTEQEIPPPPRRPEMLKPPRRWGTWITSSRPRSSTVAASTSSCAVASCAISSTSAPPEPPASIRMSPLASSMFSCSGPSVWNVFFMRVPPLALDVAGQPLAADLRGPRLGGTRDRADQPGVRRDSFAVGCALDRGLERLGKPQADASRQLFAGRRTRLGSRVVDVHELRLLACEPDFDMARGQLRRQLERGLRQQVEHPEAEVCGQRVTEAAGDQARPFVAELGDALQVFAEPFQHDGQIHVDIIMTSLSTSVKHQTSIALTREPQSGPERREPGDAGLSIKHRSVRF